MTTIESAPITPDELAEMPDNNRFELVDGQLLQRDMGAVSSWVAGEVHRQIATFGQHERQLGWAFPADCGYQCFPDSPNTLRKPDVSFIRRGRLPGEALPEGYIRIAPDLVVEVVSRHDAYEDVDEKLEMFFRAGVELVWIINPKSRTIHLLRREPGVLAELKASGSP